MMTRRTARDLRLHPRPRLKSGKHHVCGKVMHDPYEGNLRCTLRAGHEEEFFHYDPVSGVAWEDLESEKQWLL